MPAESPSGFYPGQAAIDAYGDGGFRFAGMGHRGALLVLPSGIFAWDATSVATLTPAHFARVFAESLPIEHLLLGTGAELVFPEPALAALFEARGITLEAMSTGAAARTFNILLAERRSVAAALIAVT